MLPLYTLSDSMNAKDQEESAAMPPLVFEVSIPDAAVVVERRTNCGSRFWKVSNEMGNPPPSAAYVIL